MATLEELRQKRIQDLQNRNQSSSVSDARTKAVERIKGGSKTFIEAPQGIPEAEGKIT